MKKFALMVTVTVFLVFAFSAIIASYSNDDVMDFGWRAKAYNRDVTACLEEYTSIPRVYNFDKMRDKSDFEVSKITGINEVLLASCRG